MARCVRTILKVLQNITPQSEEDIHRQLASIQSSADFAPPELDRLHWQRISEAYAPSMKPPEEGWQMYVCAILNDEKIEQLRAFVEEHNSKK